MNKKILFIPLDDRPCTFKMPIKMACVAGFEMITPPKDLMGRYHKFGNCEKILDWLGNINRTFNASIIMVDMPLYGGLIASRRQDPTLEIIEKRLNILTSIIKNQKRKLGRIYLFNTLLRTAPTYTYESEIPQIQKIIQFSRLSYLAEKGDLEAANAVAELEKEIPKTMLNNYLIVRRRNHEINKKVLNLVKSRTVDFLLIGMDDSKNIGLNILERKILEKILDDMNLNSRVLIAPGADEAACLLLVRALVDLTGICPSLWTIFSHPDSKHIIPEYEDRSFCEIIDLHIEASKCSRASSIATADIVFHIHNPEKRQKEASSQNFNNFQCSYNEFIISIKKNIRDNKKVTLADVFYSNGADVSLMDLLSKHINILKLWGFAAWNTAGNSIGSALAQSAVRFIGEELVRESNQEKYLIKEHLTLLLERFIDDWLYQADVRQMLSTEALKNSVSVFKLNGQADHFKHKLKEKMNIKLKDFFKSYVEGNTFSNKSGKVFYIKEPRLIYVDLPWGRLFEVDINFDFIIEAVEYEAVK